MKKLIKAVMLVSVLAFTGNALKAQDSRVSLNLNYNYSFPTGAFNSDIVSHNSPRGFTGNIMYRVSPLVSVGFGTGYQDYYQKYPRDIYDLGDNQKVSAVLSNSIQTIPLMARAEIYPLRNHSSFRPYVSVATGLNVINYDQYLGEFPSSSTKLGYRLQGGLGVKIPVIKDEAGLDVGGSYDFAPYHHLGMKDLNNYNVHAGFYINLK